MADPVLLDTGFAVALVNALDPDHERCREVWSGIRGPILSVEGVAVEASHLLRRTRGGGAAAIHLLLDAGVELVPADAARLRRAATLMERYRDVPMDLVDALLVTVAETHDASLALTLDVRGFRAYRIGRRSTFRILPEPRGA